MQDTTSNDTGRRFTGLHMFAVVCGFFAVVIAANAALAFYAMGSWSGLVVDNSYVASQNYNAVLAEARAQRALGWKTKLEASSGSLVFTVSDKSGRAIAGAKVEAELERPSDSGEDRTLALLEQAGGRYVHKGNLKAGLWNASVSVTDTAGRHYRRDFRLNVTSGD